MRRKFSVKILLCCITLVLIIVSACRKQYQDATYTDALSNDVQWAKDYYTNTLQPTQGNAVGIDSSKLVANSKDPLSAKMNMKSLFWQKATAGNRGNYTFVEIPINIAEKSFRPLMLK
ncbi:hypothetical protein ACFGVR_02525 [Mucilaginibacter sp. AW1-3]